MSNPKWHYPFKHVWEESDDESKEKLVSELIPYKDISSREFLSICKLANIDSSEFKIHDIIDFQIEDNDRYKKTFMYHYDELIYIGDDESDMTFPSYYEEDVCSYFDHFDSIDELKKFVDWRDPIVESWKSKGETFEDYILNKYGVGMNIIYR